MSQDNERDNAYSKIFDEQNKLENPATESARSRKWRILKTKATQLKGQAQQGFIMGALVGGGFGFIVGCWSAIQMRQLYIIPVSTVISGASFGFFMGCGTMIRSDDQIETMLHKYQMKNEAGVMNSGQIWKMRYAI